MDKKLILLISVLTAVSFSTQITINAGEEIAEVVDAHPEGTTFLIKAGLHRVSRTIRPKPRQQFIGEIGPSGERLTILNGAIVLTSWYKDGSYWVHDSVANASAYTAGYYGSCWNGWGMCMYPEDLYYDGFFLRKCESMSQLSTSTLPDYFAEVSPGNWAGKNLSSGSWYHDTATHKVYMRDDPSGHTMEISQTISCFSSKADYVVIKDLVIEKFATKLQFAAIMGGDVADVTSPVNNGWVLDNVESRLNHAVGATLYGGRGHVIRNCYIHHNGELGVKVQLAKKMLFAGNHIAYNSRLLTGAKVGEEGAAKFIRTDSIHIIGNYFKDNLGTNIWMDMVNTNVLIEGNFTDRGQEGVFLEVTETERTGVVRYNYINAAGYCHTWAYGAGILVSHSPWAEVHHNVLHVAEAKGHGLVVMYQPEDNFASNSRRNWPPHHVSFHHNDLSFLSKNHGGCARMGLYISTWGNDNTPARDFPVFWEAHRTFMDTGKVVFENNTYHKTPEDDRTHWGWPPDSADAEAGRDIRYHMIRYTLGDIQKKRGVEKGSTMDHTINTSNAAVLAKFEAWNTPDTIMTWLKKWITGEDNVPAPKPIAPTISVPAGTFTHGKTVEIYTRETSGQIHFTTDGSPPTASSPQYTQPIAINQTTTLKAIVIASGNVSPPAESRITIDPDYMPVVAQWSFEDGRTDTISGGPAINSIVITDSGGTVTSVDGQIGKALAFDDKRAWLDADAGDAPLPRNFPFTITAWVKTSDTAAMQTVLLFGGANTQSATALCIAKGKIAVLSRINYNHKRPEGTVSVADGQWHFLSAVFASRDSMRLYVDGEPAGIVSGNTFNGDYSKVLLGAWLKKKVPTEFFVGAMDEVKIIGTDLTAAKIRQMFTDTTSARFFPSQHQATRQPARFIRRNARLYVALDGNLSHSISLYAATGRRVKQISGFGTQTYAISDGTLAPGVYVLRVRNGEQLIERPVLLSR